MHFIASIFQMLPGEDSPRDPAIVHSFQMNLSYLTFILGTLIPILVGWLKRQTLSKPLQVGLMILVNLVVALGRQVLANKGLIDVQLVRDFFGQLMTTGIGYEVIIKPLGLDDIGKGIVGPKSTNPRYGIDDVGDFPLDDGTEAPIAPPSDARPPTDGSPF